MFIKSRNESSTVAQSGKSHVSTNYRSIGFSGFNPASHSIPNNISMLTGMGTKTIRLELDYWLYPTFGATEAASLVTFLDACLAANIKVILNMPNDSILGSSDKYSAANNLAFWQTVCTYVLPHAAVLACEVMNEPLYSAIPDQTTWLAHQLTVVALIRSTVSDMNIVVSPWSTMFAWEYSYVGGGTYVAEADVADLLVYNTNNNIWFTAHDYEPRGAVLPTVDPNIADPAGDYQYPNTDGTTTVHDNWNGTNPISANPVWARLDRFNAHFSPAINFINKYNAIVFIGEFSVYPESGGFNTFTLDADASLFLGDKIGFFNAYNMHWNYHAQSPIEIADGSGKGTYNLVAGTAKRTTVISYLPGGQ